MKKLSLFVALQKNIMKKLLLLIFISLLFSYQTANSQKLNIYYYQSSFWSPKDSNYNEIYMSFVGKTLKYIKNKEGKYIATVNITLTYSRNDSVFAYKKYTLSSPIVNDINFYIPNFLDVQRIKIKPGNYKFHILAVDTNNKSNKLEYSENIKVRKFDDLCFSDIELAEDINTSPSNSKFKKSGLTVLPYVSDYYPDNIKKLKFYAELYSLGTTLLKGEPAIIKYYIEPADKRYTLQQFYKIIRIKADKVIPISGGFNLKTLPTGNYNLVLECINSSNELLASKKLFFQRKNTSLKIKSGNIDSVKTENTFVELITDPDTLADYIKSLFPIMENKETVFAKNQLKAKNIEWMQKYFYNFWHNINPTSPKEEWLKYKKQVDFVNKHFSTQIKRGYETDRGRIYLRYGTPDDIIKRDHPNGSYPYEIWHYIHTRGQGNIKVVFINTSVISDYELIYTNLRGEPSDPNWKRRAIKMVEGSRNFGTQIEDDFNSL